MLSDDVKEVIRQTLVSMVRANQHASALRWIRSLPLDEEEYASGILRSVEEEAHGRPPQGGRVPMSQVWEPVPQLPSLRQMSDYDFSKIVDKMQDVAFNMGKFVELDGPGN